jgi:hypothetical protein
MSCPSCSPLSRSANLCLLSLLHRVDDGAQPICRRWPQQASELSSPNVCSEWDALHRAVKRSLGGSTHNPLRSSTSYSTSVLYSGPAVSTSASSSQYLLPIRMPPCVCSLIPSFLPIATSVLRHKRPLPRAPSASYGCDSGKSGNYGQLRLHVRSLRPPHSWRQSHWSCDFRQIRQPHAIMALHRVDLPSTTAVRQGLAAD